MARTTWAGPLLLSAFILAYLFLTDRYVDYPGDGQSPALVVDFEGREVPFGFAGGIQSARTAVSDSRWVEGSSRVLSDLSACLGDAAEYSRPVLVTEGLERPSHPTDPTDVFEYYRDVCLSRVGRQAWLGFIRSYGERPRAWVLQLMASAENEYDRLRLEPGVSSDEAWVQAFSPVAPRVDSLRRHLLAVYSRAADPADGAAGGEVVPYEPVSARR